MGIQLTVDRDLCCGSGLCWDTAPDFFDVDDEGIVVLRRSEAAPADLPLLSAAIRTCPTGTIRMSAD